ncbi:MAG TPA: alpha/beta fold hydrolase, partial [Flavisolibacter sp.]|nr:alpha/beta fold hydrolase [Flavisolibacter sp.]
EQDADDVATLLQHLDIPKAHVFGFSNGGNTAMQIALRHPNAVQKLVIASSFYKRHGMFPGFFDMMKQASLVNMPGPLKTAFLAINNDEISLQNMHDKDRDRMLNFKDWDDADLRSIKAPTLLIAADHDVVTVRHTVDMSELIPNSELMIVPGDHGSFIGEVCTIRKESRIPDMTAAVIVEFLNKKELPKS